MAGELVWRTLVDASSTGATQYDALAEFRNDSSRDIYIRKIRITARAGVMADDDDYAVEISTDPTWSTAATNGDPGFRLVAEGELVLATNGAAQSGIAAQDSYGRGQLVLEPGESLYMNAAGDSGGQVISARAVIGFEFK